MFRKISLYSELFNNRMEALLSDEAMDEEKKTFDAAVRILTLKDYDYLDFRNTMYDRDYTDFQNRIDMLTEKLRSKLEVTYDGIWDTPHSFQVGAISNDKSQGFQHSFRFEEKNLNLFFKALRYRNSYVVYSNT